MCPTKQGVWPSCFRISELLCYTINRWFSSAPTLAWKLEVRFQLGKQPVSHKGKPETDALTVGTEATDPQGQTGGRAGQTPSSWDLFPQQPLVWQQTASQKHVTGDPAEQALITSSQPRLIVFRQSRSRFPSSLPAGHMRVDGKPFLLSSALPDYFLSNPTPTMEMTLKRKYFY